jgi:hypothetical protein
MRKIKCSRGRVKLNEKIVKTLPKKKIIFRAAAKKIKRIKPFC